MQLQRSSKNAKNPTKYVKNKWPKYVIILRSFTPREQYLTSTAYDNGSKFDAIWQRQHRSGLGRQSTFPLLVSLALYLVAVPLTHKYVEWMFSMFGALISEVLYGPFERRFLREKRFDWVGLFTLDDWSLQLWICDRLPVIITIYGLYDDNCSLTWLLQHIKHCHGRCSQHLERLWTKNIVGLFWLTVYSSDNVNCYSYSRRQCSF